tara:strand:+ start:397 stop:648 length:252 start_codon:yes stop_codon:yes gene_type:complete
MAQESQELVNHLIKQEIVLKQKPKICIQDKFHCDLQEEAKPLRLFPFTDRWNEHCEYEFRSLARRCHKTSPNSADRMFELIRG